MQRISAKRVYDKTWLSRESNPLGMVQKMLIWPYEQVLHAQPRIHPGEWDAHTSMTFWDTNRSPNLGQNDQTKW